MTPSPDITPRAEAFGKLKDGTPMDGKYLAEVVALNERALWELLNLVARALPHSREECEYIAREHKRITSDLGNELRARVRAAAEGIQP